MQTPPSSQLRHWMNRVSRGTSPALYEIPSYAGQSKAVSSFPGVTLSTYESQLLRNHGNSEACRKMSLSRVACVALLLNLTMNLPMARSRRCMNPTKANRCTSNCKPFRQSNSAAEMILPCLLA
jgi:hypothetical protein